MSEKFTILGLHFGHDAAVAIVRGGKILSYILCERFSRVKHSLGLSLEDIHLALLHSGVSLEELDCVAVSSTQGIELLVDDPTRLVIEYRGEDPFGAPIPSRFAGLGHKEIMATGERSLAKMLSDSKLSLTYVSQFFNGVAPSYAREAAHSVQGVPWIDFYTADASWEKPVTLEDERDFSVEISDRLRYGFHVPLEVTLDGARLPGYAIHHHLAHAASSYYQSGFRSAAVLTHDGFDIKEERVQRQSFAERVCSAGMYYLAEEEAIYPLLPSRLGIGFLYEHVSTELGLGVSGGPGKLMGLAAYGKPRLFDESFVGNIHDVEKTHSDAPNDWLRHCLDRARELDYDLTAFASPDRITEPINADIAASTQLLFERTRLASVTSLYGLLSRAGREVTDLCMSGGTALNCPSNTDIAQAGAFERVFVEPMCDDSGIAVGAALAVHHNILGHPLPGSRPAWASPYLGPIHPHNEVAEALTAAGDAITVEYCEDAAHHAAGDLAENKIVAWYEGGSEAGPRALGHRSLLADPRNKDTWGRVNRVKGREAWRPLAPVVLEEHAAEWFSGVALPSPYMLFNADVRSNGIGAVTHVDGTARIQTVNASSGAYFKLLSSFHQRTGVPVLLNTSLNSPGEPIVERPAEAVNFLLRSNVDVLYLTGHRVTRSIERD